MRLPAGQLAAPRIQTLKDVQVNSTVTGVIVAVAKDGLGVAVLKHEHVHVSPKHLHFNS